jgi:hypothetical protein
MGHLGGPLWVVKAPVEKSFPMGKPGENGENQRKTVGKPWEIVKIMGKP